uniref:Uncharacterized protein n=1 Tax=Glycine max TaxID=3847 RepID=C6TBJ6_SOYBN|nr:unknown [Glycine max]
MWQEPDQPACRDDLNLNLNLFRSFSGTKLQGILPCSKISNCPAYSHCFHVNCGGKNVKVVENDENIHYVGDGGVLGSGAANISLIMKITGDFLDDGDQLNSRYLSLCHLQIYLSYIKQLMLLQFRLLIFTIAWKMGNIL